MSTIKNLQWRYATKKFNPNKSLSEEQINTLKEAFNLTATSYGLQPIKLVVVQNKKIQNELVAHTMNQKQIADASHVLVLCIENNLTAQEVENYFNLVKEKRNTPDVILSGFKNFLQEYMTQKTGEEIKQWATKQAYIALGNLLTVAAFEQIDSCPMEGFNAKKYDEVLNLNKHNVSSVLVLPVGFRADDDFMKDLAKVRKKTNDVVIEIN